MSSINYDPICNGLIKKAITWDEEYANRLINEVVLYRMFESAGFKVRVNNWKDIRTGDIEWYQHINYKWSYLAITFFEDDVLNFMSSLARFCYREHFNIKNIFEDIHQYLETHPQLQDLNLPQLDKIKKILERKSIKWWIEKAGGKIE